MKLYFNLEDIIEMKKKRGKPLCSDTNQSWQPFNQRKTQFVIKAHIAKVENIALLDQSDMHAK